MRIEHLTGREYAASIREKIVILPVGAIEQHGLHMPLNVDVVISSSFADRIATELDAMILPPIAYGYKSHPSTGGGQDFPGTTSLNGATLIHLTLDILNETYRHGGRRFLIMNGHLENIAYLVEAMDLFLKHAEEARVMAVSWWDVASEEMRDEIAREAGIERWEDDHAAMTETSLMLYLAPDLVREDEMVDEVVERRVAYTIFPTPSDLTTETGMMYKVSHASRDIGEQLAEQITGALVEAAHLELG
jgi:creatinine amidohydrolase